ncbi:MAG: hypothetical protein CL872_04870 [Dehalococcoidaceae bacterium]|nr:hypothetical protein [Dehalococcoidaceae bacterium]
MTTFFSKKFIILYSLILATIISAVIFPWQKEQSQIVVGEPASYTIISPTSLEYNSELLTNNRRQAAAAAVEDIFVLNPDVRDSQVALLNKQLNNIEKIRSDNISAISVKESAINSLKIKELSNNSISLIVLMSDDEWDMIVDESSNILTKILTGSISLAETENIKKRINTYISSQYSKDSQLIITEFVRSFIQPTLILDQERTTLLKEQAKAMQPVELIIINQGDVIVNQGELVTEENFETLGEIGLLKEGFALTTMLSSILKSILITILFTIFIYFSRPHSLDSLKKLILFSMILISSIGVLNIFYNGFFNNDSAFLFHLLPLLTFPMVIFVLTELSVAFILTALIVLAIVLISFDSLNASFLLNNGIEFSRTWISFFASAIIAIVVLRQAEQQQQYIYAALVSSLVTILISTIYWVSLSTISFYDLSLISICTIAGSLLSAILALGLVNFLSVPFGILTRVKLMELAQLDNQLLRRLQDEAPGTFQHSLLVGTLVERAADRINADSLLARVGAYYHDVGKLVSPAFFAENLSEKSPHEALDPLQSTRVIHQHVTAGIEIAKKENLPEVILNFIQQHHGTRLATFFYRTAVEKSPEIDPELFRYPGPKPQSKEAALVMLADSSEAAVRASKDHSSERIIEIVDEVIRERFEEEQFDECDLSIKQIRIAADSIASALIAVFHPRVDYPEPSKQELINRGIYSKLLEEEANNYKNKDGTQLSLGSIDESENK